MRNKTVTIGLQGGGSHGAFTWGVLDRLLEDGRVDIEGISGASAGAMNAVVLAHGLMLGGRDGARQALKDFWESVATGALPGGTPNQARDALFQSAYINDTRTNPNNPLFLAAKKNDLLGWSPKSRTLLCGGAGDPTVPPQVQRRGPASPVQPSQSQPRPREPGEWLARAACR